MLKDVERDRSRLLCEIREGADEPEGHADTPRPLLWNIFSDSQGDTSKTR